MIIILFIVSFLASIAGAICGIGGGVIVKPVLDAANILDVSSISFLSGCMVLSMSAYSVWKSGREKEEKQDKVTLLPLSIGAAIGGILGKQIFNALTASYPQNLAGGIQAICLIVLTGGTLIYTIYKGKVNTLQVKNKGICAGAGLILGLLSSFLGIGGGPFNLVVLYYLFSMTTKEAVMSSLYIIFLSQTASLIFSFITGTIPQVEILHLVFMVAGGILGGMTGRKCSSRLSGKKVEYLFMGMLVVIIGINMYNTWRFLL